MSIVEYTNQELVQQREDKVDLLSKYVLDMEQAPCPVTHKFAPGLYIREVVLPAGVVSIGHYQKTEHFNVMLTGRVTMIYDDGSRLELVAPLTYVSKPGRKVGYIHETVVWQNIYPTTETDVTKLEEMFIEKNDIWKEHVDKQQKLLTYDHTEDIQDYQEVLKEYNYTEEQVRREVDYPFDQIPFPYGNYKVVVSKSNIEGQGLIASGNISQGEVIAPARIDGKRTPAGRYTNHSKTPNAIMVLRDNSDIDLVALRDINGMRGGSLGEEITIDYRHALNIRGDNKCLAQ